MPAIVISAPISSNHAAPVSAGGTGATTAAAARTNLDVYSKSEVTNAISQSTAIGVWNQRAVEWASSTVSFTDAIIKLGYTAASYIAASLENIVSQKISGISDGSVSGGQVATDGPYYGYMIYKFNNNYYAGILFSYYSDQYVAFRYLNGTYKVKLI